NHYKDPILKFIADGKSKWIDPPNRRLLQKIQIRFRVYRNGQGRRRNIIGYTDNSVYTQHKFGRRGNCFTGRCAVLFETNTSQTTSKTIVPRKIIRQWFVVLIQSYHTKAAGT